VDIERLLETGAAVLILLCVFLAGGRIRAASLLLRSPRSLFSFASGIVMAYVFVYVMPELSRARTTFVNSTSLPLVNEGMAIYFLALLGFLTFFSLNRLGPDSAEPGPAPMISVKVVSFAGYVFLISYLLVDNLRETPASIALYAAAMAVHFLTFDHTFRDDFPDTYRRRGRFLLAAAALAGWGMAWVTALPRDILALMLGFVSGGVVMNSSADVLSRDNSGKIIPFITGAIVYALVLILVRVEG
jgi:hypothetical protein